MTVNGTRTSRSPAAVTDLLAGQPDERMERLAAMLPELRDLLTVSLRDTRGVPGSASAAEEERRTVEHLAWVNMVRTQLLDPATAAAVQARDTAIRRAMERGTPASSLVGACGLTVARIYQIRDGRR